jgi:hypothetical protein
MLAVTLGTLSGGPQPPLSPATVKLSQFLANLSAASSAQLLRNCLGGNYDEETYLHTRSTGNADLDVPHGAG